MLFLRSRFSSESSATKLPSAMAGHDAPIHLPPGAGNPHYEGEKMSLRQR